MRGMIINPVIISMNMELVPTLPIPFRFFLLLIILLSVSMLENMCISMLIIQQNILSFMPDGGLDLFQSFYFYFYFGGRGRNFIHVLNIYINCKRFVSKICSCET